MSHGGAHAIGAGVASTNHDHVLPGGVDETPAPLPVEQRLRVALEKFHGEMDPGTPSPLNRQITRLGGSGRKHHRVKFLHQPVGGKITPHLHPAPELDPFLLHLRDAAKHNFLLVQLHVWDAIH